jgi:hypothetical protein
MKYEGSQPQKPCTDCMGLLTGTRSLQTPHSYLVPNSGNLGQTQPLGTTKSYRCLICKTTLTHEAEASPSWR